MADLEESGSRFPNLRSRLLDFSLITTFYLTKVAKTTKRMLNTALIKFHEVSVGASIVFN